MRIALVLLATLCACAADATSPDECAPFPDTGVLIRTELEGTCGPQPRLVSKRSDATPPGCTLKREPAECFVYATLVCASGLQREWWLDGSSGRIVGEEKLCEPSCCSTYRLELDPR